MTAMPQPLLLEPPRRERPALVPPARLERVLIVEDDPVQAILLSLMLERLHVQYLLVTDGGQAIEAVKRERFRLVLMDYLMPVTNGIEATRQIRRFEREHDRERVAIVAVTASVMRSECDAYLAAGMDDVVLKPFSAQSLADAVARHGAARTLTLFVPGVVS